MYSLNRMKARSSTSVILEILNNSVFWGEVYNDAKKCNFNGTPDVVNSSLSGPANVSSLESIPVLCVIKDKKGSPISGIAVNFAASVGEVDPVTAVTDDNGLITAIYTAPAVSDDLPVLIYATVSDLVVYYEI